MNIEIMNIRNWVFIGLVALLFYKAFYEWVYPVIGHPNTVKEDI